MQNHAPAGLPTPNGRQATARMEDAEKRKFPEIFPDISYSTTGKPF
jgi:hypothetical protein